MYNADFHFTKEEIYANRYGKLTPSQEELINAIYQTRQHGAVQTIAVFIVFFVVLIVMGFGVEFNQWQGTVSDFIDRNAPIFLMVVSIFSLILIVGVISNFLVAQDVRRRRISTAEGKASVFVGQAWSRGNAYMRYELTLKNGFIRTGFFRFMSETAVRQFESGKRYRVYYIKFYPLPIVLSAEEID
jgi:ABC-type uncharacterized transport system fused permease/ATPase subunit